MARLYFRRFKAAWSQLHVLARAALNISWQLAGCLALFGLLVERLMPYMPDYFTAVAYQRAAFENAPAMLLAGVIAACIADTMPRR